MSKCQYLPFYTEENLWQGKPSKCIQKTRHWILEPLDTDYDLDFWKLSWSEAWFSPKVSGSGQGSWRYWSTFTGWVWHPVYKTWAKDDFPANISKELLVIFLSTHWKNIPKREMIDVYNIVHESWAKLILFKLLCPLIFLHIFVPKGLLFQLSLFPLHWFRLTV